MHYFEAPPPAELAPWIAAVWRFRVERDAGEIEHRIPLTGGLLLSAGSPAGAMLLGPRTAPFTTTVRGGDEYFGVHFHPGGARSLLHLAEGSLRDALGPAPLWLDAAWCARWGAPDSSKPGAEAGEGRLVAALLDLAPRAAPLDSVVMIAVHRLVRSHGAEPIAGLARAAGLSPRQLRRRFVGAVGLAPKQLARLRRLRAAAADAVLADRPWAEIMAERGYADQPHLVREFKRLLGVTPVGFERHAQRIDHRLLDEPEDLPDD